MSDKTTYTATELAELAAIKYDDEEFSGDELDMVRSAVYWAVRQDRLQHVASIEALKQNALGISDAGIRHTVSMHNGALHNAQTAVLEAGL